MDVFTHILLPAALWTALRRPRREVLAVGLGGYAPDLDVFLTWMTRVSPDAWFFVHRGFSHTFWGGPLLALGLLAAATRLRTRWKPLSSFEMTGAAAAAAVLGSWSHVFLLDPLTITGTPALWPLSDARLGLNFFFYSVTLALPVALAVLVLRARGRIGDRGLVVGALLVVLVTAGTGAVRAATYPDAGDGDVVVPTPSNLRWIHARPVAGGWNVTLWSDGAAGETRAYASSATDASLAAADLCRRTGVYKAWRWNGSGAEIVNATPVDGGHHLLIEDVAARFRHETGAWSLFGWSHDAGDPYDPEEQGIRCTVRGGAVSEVLRPAGFWG